MSAAKGMIVSARAKRRSAASAVVLSQAARAMSKKSSWRTRAISKVIVSPAKLGPFW